MQSSEMLFFSFSMGLCVYMHASVFVDASVQRTASGAILPSLRRDFWGVAVVVVGFFPVVFARLVGL